jgi:hypothetical protein
MLKFNILLVKNGYSFQIAIEAYDYNSAFAVGEGIAGSFGATFCGVAYAN